MSSQAKFTIAIVGGGIGGLAFAVALTKTGVDFDVDIYESAPNFGEIGAGIGIWPRVWKTLVNLGLEEDLKKQFTHMGQEGKMAYYKGDQAHAIYCGHAQQSMHTYHRAEFLKILERHIPPNYRTHFSKRLVSYEDIPPNPIVLHFKDGTTAKCDVLVGADGIKSAVRRNMFTALASNTQDESQAAAYTRCVDATWSGSVAYRGLVQAEAFTAEYPDHPAISAPVCYMGKYLIVLAYPISQGQIVNSGAVIANPSRRGTIYEGPWVTEATNEEMVAHFPNWDPQAYGLLKAMGQPSKWAINEVRELPTFISGRVALLGDAAHAMTPHLASGSGQAVEDAVFLANLLAQPETTKDNIVRALKIYDESRRPFAQNVQELSFKVGQIAWLDSPRVQSYSAEDSTSGVIPENVLKELLTKDWVDLHKRTREPDPQVDLQLAIHKLRET
ncbi:FAD/NAD(P)-binding domain-containing protein [Irpex rosettiformis]|uniref:FAD/NAD(P)-binding domain-containing protein n=1 Tax=Irpex rosettiformis TaxID=378272 RepID=A0ACB8TWI5_9APHY|nr:FAD/NAD(P)-binding domain-containing protein [Irpex rosettiformis]